MVIGQVLHSMHTGALVRKQRIANAEYQGFAHGLRMFAESITCFPLRR
jgi:hypothetical protein